MFFVVRYQFVLRQKSSPRTPGSFHGVAMPGFVHVGFLPSTGITFLALFPKHLSLLIEVFFHLGSCLPALQNPPVLLSVDKGRSGLGRSHHLLLGILEVLLLLLRSLLYSHLWLLHGSRLLLKLLTRILLLLLMGCGCLEGRLGMMGRSGRVHCRGILLRCG